MKIGEIYELDEMLGASIHHEVWEILEIEKNDVAIKILKIDNPNSEVMVGKVEHDWDRSTLESWIKSGYMRLSKASIWNSILKQCSHGNVTSGRSR